MKIYNTMTRQKEELQTITPNEVKIYACGPTVYNFIHIGNARPICVFDTFRRYLEYRGYKVTFVQNFTDIDSLVYFMNLANKYPKNFFCHLDKDSFVDSSGNIKGFHLRNGKK